VKSHAKSSSFSGLIVFSFFQHFIHEYFVKNIFILWISLSFFIENAILKARRIFPCNTGTYF